MTFYGIIYIEYYIESATYGFLFTSCKTLNYTYKVKCFTLIVKVILHETVIGYIFHM